MKHIEVKTEKKGMRQIVKIMILAAMMILAISCFTACGSTTVDLDKYVTITTSGYDTMGTAHATFDDEAFIRDYQGKLKLTDSGKSYAFWIGYDSDAELLDDLIWGSLDQTSGLSNGDIVTYSWNIDSSAESYFSGLKLKYDDIQFEITDLEDVQTFDAFADVTLSVSGTAPSGKATLEVDSSLFSSSNFTMDVSSGLSNGDVVTVTLSSSAADRVMEDYGMYPATLSAEYVVEGLPHYATSLDEIPSESLEKMDAQATDAFNANNTWGSVDQLNDFKLVGYYFLTEKDGFNKSTVNYLYLIYQVDVSVFYYDEDGVRDDIDLTYYWYVGYSNIIVMPDGTLDLDITSYSKASTSFQIDTYIVNAAGFRNWTYATYKGYQSYDAIYRELVTSNIEYYTFEDTVSDTVSQGSTTMDADSVDQEVE